MSYKITGKKFLLSGDFFTPKTDFLLHFCYSFLNKVVY